MSRRSRAREMALQMLYQQDLNPDMPADTVLELIQERMRDEDLSRFAWKLFVGVMECRAAIDAKIEALAANWSLKRMPPTDRNVLRIGAFELLYTTETPARVAIDEALELAKRYGSAQSSTFVNGILDRLIPPGRVERASEPEGDEDTAPPDEDTPPADEAPPPSI